MRKNLVFLFVAVLLVQSTYGAFSTPFLPNNTLVLGEAQEEYKFEIVFQNTGVEDTVMNFEVIKGKDWIDPDEFSIDVAGKTYDTQGSFMIKIPETIEGEDGEQVKVKTNTPYQIEYAISTGDKGGGGMVPVTSAVKKKFEIIIEEEETETGYGIWILAGMIVIAGGAYLWNERRKKKKDEQQEEGKESTM